MRTSLLDEAVARALSATALEAATMAGASLAQVRVEAIRSQHVALRDAVLESSSDTTDFGVSVRVLVDGVLGFAASVESDRDAVAALARRAVATARSVAAAQRRPVELAPEPSHGEVRWSSPHVVDPTMVPLADKVALLGDWSRRVLDAPGISHVGASVLCVAEDKHYADTAGTTAFQRRVRIYPSVEATALDDRLGFETMATIAPPAGRGWEYVSGDGWDFDAELAELGANCVAKLHARSVEPGHYDLVVDPTNLWLTIHESIGHATELDRALGYEAAYAGTSFATPDLLGTLAYGSPLLNVTGDRTAAHGLATCAIDDEGVEAQSFDLIRDGLLVGYQLDRATAAVAGQARSNGCAYADSALHVPIQRMANVSLTPSGPSGPSTEDLIAGVDRGIYVVGDKSWSIDMQRYNFQFTGQRFYEIRGGQLVGQLRDVAYQATTTDFWGKLAGVGGDATYLLAGAFNCGKGQPGQVAPVSHGCPSVLVEDVAILNTRAEGGRS